MRYKPHFYIMVLAVVVVATSATGVGGKGSALGSSSQQPQTFYGPAKVIDGDTLIVGTKHAVTVRLWGVDAMERDQTCVRGSTVYACGKEARTMLDSLVKNHIVVCGTWGEQTYERIVAMCKVDGQDLGAAVVGTGWALDVPRVSDGYYAATEAAARQAGRGAHAGEFQRPDQWRAERR